MDVLVVVVGVGSGFVVVVNVDPGSVVVVLDTLVVAGVVDALVVAPGQCNHKCSFMFSQVITRL